MKISSLYFTTEEKIEFLTDIGFVIKKEKIKMFFSIYYNDVEEKIMEVFTVKKDNKYYKKPCSSFCKEEWLDSIFEEQISNKLKMILLSPPYI